MDFLKSMLVIPNGKREVHIEQSCVHEGVAFYKNIYFFIDSNADLVSITSDKVLSKGNIKGKYYNPLSDLQSAFDNNEIYSMSAYKNNEMITYIPNDKNNEKELPKFINFAPNCNRYNWENKEVVEKHINGLKVKLQKIDKLIYFLDGNNIREEMTIKGDKEFYDIMYYNSIMFQKSYLECSIRRIEDNPWMINIEHLDLIDYTDDMTYIKIEHRGLPLFILTNDNMYEKVDIMILSKTDKWKLQLASNKNEKKISENQFLRIQKHIDLICAIRAKFGWAVY